MRDGETERCAGWSIRFGGPGRGGDGERAGDVAGVIVLVLEFAIPHPRGEAILGQDQTEQAFSGA